jgi:hypothetical protein
MICPKCEYEYQEGIDVCPDCGEELISLEEFKGHLIEPDDWTTVYTCSETYVADMMKANLKGAGIESMVLVQKDRSYPAVGDLAVVKLKVLKSDKNAALEIIQDIERDQDNSQDSD